MPEGKEAEGQFQPMLARTVRLVNVLGTTSGGMLWLSFSCSSDKSCSQFAKNPLVSYKNEAVGAKACKSPVQPSLPCQR